MPIYEVHKKIGFIFSFILIVLLVYYFSEYIPNIRGRFILIPLIIIFYSNLPDLDFQIGKLKRKTLSIIFLFMVLSGIIAFFINIGLMLVLLMFIGLLGIELLKVKHRGPMHTYWFVTIVSLPLLLLNWFFFLIGLTCSYLHIFIDRLFSKSKRKAKKFFGISGDRRDYYFHFRL